jgi:phenylacetate-CoA ligase
MPEINLNTMDIKNSQLESLEKIVRYVFKNSAYYQKTFQPFLDSTSSKFDIDLFKKLPFTTKEDLGSNNDAFRCVPKNEIAEYVTTSGITGAPVSLYLTKNDLERLAKNERDSLELMGNTSDDLFQLLTTIDKQFMAGLAYFLGVQKLGAGIIRIGPGVPELQWNSIIKYRPTTLIAVPSFIVTLIEFAKKNKIDYNNTSVTSIVCIGEPIRNNDFTYNSLGKRITDNWNVNLYSTYASTEMGAAFSECTEQKGCHLNDELLFLEVLKQNGQEALNGESGEIVITTLEVEGTPLIRYKTGDIAQVYHNKCDCGKNTTRLGPIIGRKNQMIKYKGTTLYPKAIFEVLEQFTDVSCFKIIVDKNELSNDEITILLENKIKSMPAFESIKELCKAKLRVLPKFNFVEANVLRAMVYKKHMRKPEKIKFN